MTDRLLVALDIDGTILDVDGEIPQSTRDEVARLREQGHEVMLATGRSAADMLPVRERLGLDSRYLVSANGAMVLARDEEATPPTNADYSPKWIETFDPTDALIRLRPVLQNARFAVEGPDGVYRYSGSFPDGSFEARGAVRRPARGARHAPRRRLARPLGRGVRRAGARVGAAPGDVLGRLVGVARHRARGRE
jgi:hypothetical protein